MQNADRGGREKRRLWAWCLSALLAAALDVVAETPQPAPEDAGSKSHGGARMPAPPAGAAASLHADRIDGGRVSVILWDEPENRGDKKPQLLQEKAPGTP